MTEFFYKQQISATSESVDGSSTFMRRPGVGGQHGELYEIKMAAFLFARALHKAEEFYVASNVDGAGAFDDLVFRYRLREPDVWKTCFIQLKHKKVDSTIKLSSLTKMSGDFSLFKYFESYCEIKRKSATDPKLKKCGPFDDFEFVIYTNATMERNSALQGKDSDPLSILSSGNDNWKYITFDKTHNKDIFVSFQELERYYELVRELEGRLEMIDSVQNSVTNVAIKRKLNQLKSTVNKDGVTALIKELEKCDFNLYEEFLSKVKIFQNQSNEKSLEELIKKEIIDACKASPSVANCIYTKYVEGFSRWWEQVGNVVWLSKDSKLWQNIEKCYLQK